MPVAKGLFVVFEGIDGAGKSTQAALLRDALIAAGKTVDLSAEFTAEPIGQMIRKIHRDEIETPALYRERIIALLFAADRLDHIGRVIEPALATKDVVISDRYVMSSLAYQSVFAKNSWVKSLNRWARKPDLTIFLDVQPSIAVDRIDRRSDRRERYEHVEVLQRVRDAYLRLLQQTGAGHVILDGSRSTQSVFADVSAAVEQALSRKGKAKR